MAYCYDGKTYETIKEMAEEYGIDRQRIYSFRRRGWSLEDAMQMCIKKVQNSRRSGRSLQRGTREENYAMGQKISEQI